MAPQKPRLHSKSNVRRSRPSSGDPLLERQRPRSDDHTAPVDESSSDSPRRTVVRKSHRSREMVVEEEKETEKGDGRRRDEGKRKKGRERIEGGKRDDGKRKDGKKGDGKKHRTDTHERGGIVRGKEKRYAKSRSEESTALSLGALAKLDALNEKVAFERAKREKVVEEKARKEGRARERGSVRQSKGRRVSGPTLEEGRKMEHRGGYADEEERSWSKRKKIWMIIGAVVVLLLIFVPVGVVIAGKQNGGGASSDGSTPANANLKGMSSGSIPPSAKGSILDPFTWYDTTDFNVSYTDQTIGGLPIMGLNSTWDDSTRANEFVPPLNETFKYGQMPIRGINIGGWLSIEPFITPSLFDPYDSKLNVIDEFSLCFHLGSSGAAQVLEKHYATFINRQSFADIQDAGFDHVRIPFSYWAVTTYAGDPYVPKISWRYLLRGIEYARQHGLRVNLDLHAVPGSQNGWNHSGRQGPIGWLNGTDGALNGQRSLDLHGQLSAFFAQARYRNVVGLYGLVNEPKMTRLVTDDVLAWTQKAVATVRQNGITQAIVFGDGFLGLPHWQGKLQGLDGLVLDAHQYVIFNQQQIAFSHETKLNFACSGWSGQMRLSVSTASGYVISLSTVPTVSASSASSLLLLRFWFSYLLFFWSFLCFFDSAPRLILEFTSLTSFAQLILLLALSRYFPASIPSLSILLLTAQLWSYSLWRMVSSRHRLRSKSQQLRYWLTLGRYHGPRWRFLAQHIHTLMPIKLWHLRMR